jgi:hypothetical protein
MYFRRQKMKVKAKDLAGQRFGRLLVNGRGGSTRRIYWICNCDCGKILSVRQDHLLSGATKSCGCLGRENSIKAHLGKSFNTTHGLSNKRLYKIWYGMLERCYKLKHQAFDDYGGRGITVCSDWRNDVTAFYQWAIKNGYSDNLTLDRIDVNGNYDPSNCQWATWKQQNSNKRNNHLIEYQGIKMTLSEWANSIGIDKRLLDRRLSSGWNLDKALLGKRYDSHGVLLERALLLSDHSGIDEDTIQGFEVEE